MIINQLQKKYSIIIINPFSKNQIILITYLHFDIFQSITHQQLTNQPDYYLRNKQNQMSIEIDKNIYSKYWELINPSKQKYIDAQKTIKWTQSLLAYELDLMKQKTKPNKSQNKNKGKKNQKVSKNQQKNNQKQQPEKINKKQSGKKTKKNQKEQPKHQQKPVQQTLQYLEQLYNMQQQQIKQYIKKYIQTDQYKTFPKDEHQIQAESGIMNSKNGKQQKSSPKKDDKAKKSLLSKGGKKNQQKKYEQEILIILSYEEAIYFYYWIKKNHQKVLKQQFMKKIRSQELEKHSKNILNDEQINQINQQGTTGQINSKPTNNGYKPKYFMDLSERQLIYLNQESFLSLKYHEPKLYILFKHYSKISHQAATKKTAYVTFQQFVSQQKVMNLHQWMIFCKDWSLLNAKNINQGQQMSKVTKEFLMEVYFKNSLNRKQMSFQMFRRAIVMLAGRMFGDCDVYKAKPIDLMLIFLFIKEELKFVQKLDQKGIKYTQGEILNCFKDKNRDVYEKISLVKITENERLKRMKLLRARQKRMSLDQFHTQQNNQQTKESKIQPSNSQQSFKSSRLTFNSNRKSMGNLQSNPQKKIAPNIGIHLPKIENNKYFNHIPQNANLNKFRQYIENQVPQSSSVLRNKITGYHKIHTLNNMQEMQKISENNKKESGRLSSLINMKLQNVKLNQSDLFNLKKSKVQDGKRNNKGENNDKNVDFTVQNGNERYINNPQAVSSNPSYSQKSNKSPNLNSMMMNQKQLGQNPSLNSLSLSNNRSNLSSSKDIFEQLQINKSQDQYLNKHLKIEQQYMGNRKGNESSLSQYGKV